FRISNDGTGFTNLHDFLFAEGWGPHSLLQAGDGSLVGVASSGGIRTPPGIGNGAGTVFRLTLCSIAQAPLVAAPHCLAPGTPGLVASAIGSPSDTYYWSVFGGTITSGRGTQTITFTSGAAGTRMTVQAVETDASGCVGSTAEYAQVDF